MYLILYACLYILDSGYAQTQDTYEDQNSWPVNFPQCGEGNQSPIEILFDRTIPVSIPSFEFYGYSEPIPAPLIFQQNDNLDDISRHRQNNAVGPYISNKLLKDKYLFDSFHFHWGSRDNEGSEHVINGRGFPLELHIIHRRAKYASLREAINFEDGLLVFGIFYEISARDNPNLTPIIDIILAAPNTTNFTYTPVPLKRLMGNININQYYTYFGSLTIPPCNKAVTWVVFPQPSKISRRQLQVIRSVIGTNGERMRSNFRFTQPLNNRPVYRNVGYDGGKKPGFNQQSKL